MKEYEIYSEIKIPKNSDIILRLDGRSFHSLSRSLNLEKPYDLNFTRLMVDVSKDLFKEFAPSFIYTFSDEISILLKEIPFNGRIEKINSVIAGFASSSFSFHLNSYFDDILLNKPVSFDCRIIPIVKSDISDYFKWRQDEAWRNCINAYGIWAFNKKYSPKEANLKIKGLKSNEIHEFLFNAGINLNNIDNWKKRGVGLYKKKKSITGFNKKENKPTQSFRKYIFEDYNLPLFSQKFFKELNIIN